MSFFHCANCSATHCSDRHKVFRCLHRKQRVTPISRPSPLCYINKRPPQSMRRTSRLTLIKSRTLFRAAISIRTVGFTQNQLFGHETPGQTTVFTCQSEQRGRRCVYSGVIWSVVVILGPGWVSVLSGTWTRAWSTHQGSHNVSGYTQAALTGCQSVWRKMLLGQTVSSLWQIPVHWQPAIITSLSLVVILFLTLGGKKFVFFPILSAFPQWGRSKHPKLKSTFVWSRSLVAPCNIALDFTNHMLLVRRAL